MRGRPAKPMALKQLDGTRTHRADRPDQPAPGEEPQTRELVELGEPPKFLGEYGEDEWYRVGPLLIEARLLTEADLAAFATYCMTLNVLIESKKAIDRDGMTIEGKYGKVRNPALASFASATSALTSLAAQFGMTPSSRARIKLPAKDDIPELGALLGPDNVEDAEE